MELDTLSALELGAALREKRIGCEEATSYFLDRIEKFNPDFRSFTYVAAKRALRSAQRWDAAKRKPEGALSGVPTAMKDLNWVRFMPAQMGSAAFRYFWAPVDDPVTARIRKAGMIILGKTATSEFGALPVTEPVLHAPTGNAFDAAYAAGGSSGGAGSAMGTGLLPIAHGSDGGGSIRIPASLNGVYGFKHTRGLSIHQAPPDAQLKLTVAGPLSRTVADAAAYMDLIAKQPTEFARAFSLPPPRLKIRVSIATSVVATHPEHVKETMRIAELLRSLGHQVEECPWIDLTEQDFLVLWRRLMANIPVLVPSKLEPVTRWLREAGVSISKAHALETREKMERQIDKWFEGADLWLSPSTASTAPKHGEVQSAAPEETFRRVLGLGAFTAPWNVGGHPAASLPTGQIANGVGIGVQLAGARGNDALVLQASHEVERAIGGFWRRPHLAK